MFPIYGILATQTPDRVGEVLNIEGADISELKYVNDEHSSDNCFTILGSCTLSKKIFSEQDCLSEFEHKCWTRVRKPFIYMEGALATPEHPNAAAAEGLIRYAQQVPGFPVGLSVEGATLERRGKELLKTKIIAASITVKPCNTECLVFPKINLQKSFVELPERYKGVKPGRKSFYEMPTEDARLLSKSLFLKDVNTLMKSGEPLDSATVLKCWNCGEAKLFMRHRPPNRCVACQEPFTISDIFKAVTSDRKIV
jgi:hypothetical protein